MTSKIPTVRFSNGKEIPILGLGTWKSKPSKVTQAVQDAIDAGYRHIDCAYVYENENEVGEGIRQKICSGDVKREDLFVTSKIWNTFHQPNLVEKACKISLDNLCLEYLDLYLIHWPVAFKEGTNEIIPKDANGNVLYSDGSYIDMWPEMEKLVEKGLVRSIGVSNFNSKQIDEILSVAKIRPVTNQVECHPYLNQKKLKEFCEARGILITGYSPLGSPDRPWAAKNEPLLMEDPEIVNIAKKYSKSPAQILIKYQVQRNFIVIAKSVTKERIISNAQVFDFILDPSDMAKLDSLNKGLRFVFGDVIKNSKYNPFAIEF